MRSAEALAVPWFLGPAALCPYRAYAEGGLPMRTVTGITSTLLGWGGRVGAECAVECSVRGARCRVELSYSTQTHTHYQFGLRSLVVRIRMACSDASFGGGSLRHRQTRACSSKAWLVRVLVLCWQRESQFRGDLAGIVPGCLEFGGIFHTRGRATVRLFLFSAAEFDSVLLSLGRASSVLILEGALHRTQECKRS